MGKRLLVLMLLVGAIGLLIAGVATAAEVIGGADEQGTDPNTVTSNVDTTLTDPTTVIEPTDVTDSTNVIEPTTESTEPVEVTEPAEMTPESTVHPDNFGGTISSMRHSGDFTPAAVVKGKTVPGWAKKQPTTTAPTTGAPQG